MQMHSVCCHRGSFHDMIANWQQYSCCICHEKQNTEKYQSASFSLNG